MKSIGIPVDVAHGDSMVSHEIRFTERVRSSVPVLPTKSQSLVPIAVGHAVAVAVGAIRVREVLVNLLEVAEAVAVRIGVTAGATGHQKAGDQRAACVRSTLRFSS